MNSEPKNVSHITAIFKPKFIKWTVIAGIVIVLFIFFQGYSRAKNKYETMIGDLRAQIEELEKEPIVWDETPTTEITVDFIESQIKEIGELATVEYLYTNAGKFEDPKQIFGVNVPFTTKSFIAKWDGIIKAGVKIDKIAVEIHESNKEILIHIPNAEILSHEIYSDSLETLDEKNGLFNPVKVEDVREFDAINKEAMEKRAIEHGILEQSYENAKKIIEKLVNHDAVQEEGYHIKFAALD